jgi:hypothetical protein
MPAATDDDCLDAVSMDELLQSDGLDEVFSFAYPAKLREKHDGELETLELSAYATAGELERRFIVLEPDAKTSGGLLKDDWMWKMPKKERELVGKNGKLVRFFFTILDRKGGFDVTTRSLCIKK